MHIYSITAFSEAYLIFHSSLSTLTKDCQLRPKIVNFDPKLSTSKQKWSCLTQNCPLEPKIVMFDPKLSTLSKNCHV